MIFFKFLLKTYIIVGNEYPQCMFWIKDKKIRFTSANPVFFLYKSGVTWINISRTSLSDEYQLVFTIDSKNDRSRMSDSFRSAIYAFPLSLFNMTMEKMRIFVNYVHIKCFSEYAFFKMCRFISVSVTM